MRRILGLDAPPAGRRPSTASPTASTPRPGCGITRSRMAEVVGRRAGRCSLGVGQRLGIATALLGDPATVILDEPLNGLDPEASVGSGPFGGLAAEGRTVVVSSHLLNELALTARHLIVIGRGGLLADPAWPTSSPGPGAAGSGSAAPTRRRWPPGSAPRRWPSPRAPAGPDRVRAEHRPGRPHRRGGRDHPASTIGADQGPP
jgi:hypothetical protein